MMLAQIDPQKIFGTVQPPPGTTKYADPVTGLPNLIKLVVNFFILVAGLLMLTYMLWGALDWINSGGDKERLAKAQSKITNAVVGLLLVFVVIVVFGLIAGDILNIVHRTPQGWTFTLPTP